MQTWVERGKVGWNRGRMNGVEYRRGEGVECKRGEGVEYRGVEGIEGMGGYRENSETCRSMAGTDIYMAGQIGQIRGIDEGVGDEDMVADDESSIGVRGENVMRVAVR